MAKESGDGRHAEAETQTAPEVSMAIEPNSLAVILLFVLVIVTETVAYLLNMED